MSGSEEIVFQTGGRYRNRFGWYEVLEIYKEDMLVRYESDGRQQRLDLRTQKNIMRNIRQEESSVCKYNDDEANQKFFQTIGYLSKKGFIEAIIPPKSKDGFDQNFFHRKARYPKEEDSGYYIHHNIKVDKWGVEMRLSFPNPQNFLLEDLDFGPDVNIVKSPNESESRINNNAFCWFLIEIGFELGDQHDNDLIFTNVPEKFRNNFLKGQKLT